MASVSTRANGVRIIQFKDANGKRRTLHLGQMPKKAAETICHHLSHLVACSIAGSASENSTADYVAKMGDDLHAKLANLGLVRPRESATLGKFTQAYIDSRKDAKPNFTKNMKAARKMLVAHFGEDRNLRDITTGQAEEWRQDLVNSEYAEATIARWVKIARHFMERAQRRQLVTSNPFSAVKAGSEVNDARLVFVTQEQVNKAIEAAPDAEWKCLIALSRYLGVRVPSEALAIEWSHIDWEQQTITVPSPKTEKQGKPFRVVPLFVELRPHLEAAFAS